MKWLKIPGKRFLANTSSVAIIANKTAIDAFVKFYTTFGYGRIFCQMKMFTFCIKILHSAKRMNPILNLLFSIWLNICEETVGRRRLPLIKWLILPL